jgi:hypothetical protein
VRTPVFAVDAAGDGEALLFEDHDEAAQAMLDQKIPPAWKAVALA